MVTHIHGRTPLWEAPGLSKAAGVPVLVVVCGGAGVTREQLAKWEREV